MTGRRDHYQEMFLHASQPEPSPEVDGAWGRAFRKKDPSTQGRFTHVLLGPQMIWQLSPSHWCQRPRTEGDQGDHSCTGTHTQCSATASPLGQEQLQWQKIVNDLPKCGHGSPASKLTVWGRRHTVALGEVAASQLSCSQSSMGTALTWQSCCPPPSPALPQFSFNQSAPCKVQLEGRSFQQGQGQVSDQLQFALRSFTCMTLSAVNTGSIWGWTVNTEGSHSDLCTLPSLSFQSSRHKKPLLVSTG